MVPLRTQHPAVRYAVETAPGGKQILEILRFDFGSPADTLRWRDHWISLSPETRARRTHAQVVAQIRRTTLRHGEAAAWLPLPSPDPHGTATDLFRLNLDRKPRSLPPVSEIPPALQSLTPAQFRVLQCFAESKLTLTTPELASRLGMAGATVNNHFAAILRKLGAGNREHAESVYKAAMKNSRK